jgi:hypothetical protein
VIYAKESYENIQMIDTILWDTVMNSACLEHQ